MFTNNVERTGIRDLELSQKLRNGFGFVTDVDGVWLCFFNQRPAALIEYKHSGSEDPLQFLSTGRGNALRILSDNSQIPFFLIVYDRQDMEDHGWVWQVCSGNEWATRFLDQEEPCVMSDAEYASFNLQVRAEFTKNEFSSFKQWQHPNIPRKGVI